jgi:hypothetical protein
MRAFASSGTIFPVLPCLLFGGGPPVRGDFTRSIEHTIQEPEAESPSVGGQPERDKVASVAALQLPADAAVDVSVPERVCQGEEVLLRVAS